MSAAARAISARVVRPLSADAITSDTAERVRWSGIEPWNDGTNEACECDLRIASCSPEQESIQIEIRFSCRCYFIRLSFG